MGTEIKTWQIVDCKLQFIETTLKSEGLKEPYDLEPWIASNPSIVGDDICIIGEQVTSQSGPIDLLGMDRSGNTVIIELKRDELPRVSLAQAIDYASDVAGWTVEHLSEVCTKHTGKTLEEFFNESFPDIDLEGLNLNNTQRIVLVGFSMESSLDRMIEWLSDGYGVNVNGIVLSYVKTKSGDELLTKTSIISEELEQERVGKQKKFVIKMSDVPGTHEISSLKELLLHYLSRDKVTNQRIRDFLLPACLKKKVVTREDLKKEFLDAHYDESKVEFILMPISGQLGMLKNDFLRQILAYETPKHPWEKDNFSIRDQYRDLVKDVLTELKQK
jgi:hypothetical protein